jgi:SlyX protein
MSERSRSDANRLAELESQSAFNEEMLAKLSEVVARQDGELQLLRQQLEALASRLRDLGEGMSASVSGADEEPPPHY